MGIACLALALGSTAYAQEQNSWTWSQPDTAGAVNQEAQPLEDYVADETSYYGQQAAAENATATDVDDVIDNILVSNRQGRNIEGLDDFYQDPSVKQALESGDDTQARNVIKDRLCHLGLMQVNNKIKYIT